MKNFRDVVIISAFGIVAISIIVGTLYSINRINKLVELKEAESSTSVIQFN